MQGWFLDTHHPYQPQEFQQALVLVVSTASFLAIIIDIKVAKTKTSFLTPGFSFKDTCWQNDLSFCSRSIQSIRYLILPFWK